MGERDQRADSGKRFEVQTETAPPARRDGGTHGQRKIHDASV